MSADQYENRWSLAEDNLLRAAAAYGLTQAEGGRRVSRVTGRTFNACLARAASIGVRFEKIRAVPHAGIVAGQQHDTRRRKCSRCWQMFSAPSPYRFRCDTCLAECAEIGHSVSYGVRVIHSGHSQVGPKD